MSLVDVLLALVVALPVALVVHELGHWLAARALGDVAPSVHFGTTSRAWGMRVEAALDGKARTVAFLAAGPVTSFLFGVALAAAGGVFAVVGAVSVVFASTCAFGSDGRGVVRALRTPGNDVSRAAR